MRERGDNAEAARWSILVKSGPFGAFAIILGGILLHALNSLITDTLLPIPRRSGRGRSPSSPGFGASRS
jgi:hypothetical protein